MSAVRTIWRQLAVNWVDDDPYTDVIVLVLQANGKEYIVTCAGPKDMKSDEFISAIRIAAGLLIRAGGGDMSVVGCGTPDDATFDTGDQRTS
jgi:hypothetical protein